MKGGADEGTRTLDRSFTKRVLYQLSYIGYWLVFTVCQYTSLT